MLTEDREAILGVLTRNFLAAGSRERFEWLYRTNPAGTSLAWVAEDTATGAIVGTTAAHFKEAFLGDRLVKVLNLSDFAFDQGYRSPGYALKLLKASLAPIEAGEYELAYDHPSPALAALYQRLRRSPLARWRRYVRRLRVDDVVHKLTRKSPLVDVALFGVHLAVRLRDRLVEGRSHGLELRSGAPTPAELDRLDAEWKPARFRLARSAAYVKWRFLENVTGRHEILAAYGRGGRLAGYVIHRPGEQETLRILDLVAAGDDARVRRSLLGAVLGVAHAGRKRSVAITTLANGPAERVFEALGFWRRQEGPGVFVSSRNERDGRADPGAWWLVEGDEDV